MKHIKLAIKLNYEKDKKKDQAGCYEALMLKTPSIDIKSAYRKLSHISLKQKIFFIPVCVWTSERLPYKSLWMSRFHGNGYVSGRIRTHLLTNQVFDVTRYILYKKNEAKYMKRKSKRYKYYIGFVEISIHRELGKTTTGTCCVIYSWLVHVS